MSTRRSNGAITLWRDDLWHKIEQTPYLDWLLLTKRPQNIAKMLPTKLIGCRAWGSGWPNVWLGTTAENQEEYDRRWPALKQIRAVVHFLSCEPLLSEINFRFAADDYVPSWIIGGGESGPRARPAHPDWFRSMRDQCGAAGVAFHFKQWGEFAYEGQINPSTGRQWLWPLDCEAEQRVGKSRAGRLLDGVEHNEFPQVHHD